MAAIVSCFLGKGAYGAEKTVDWPDSPAGN